MKIRIAKKIDREVCYAAIAGYSPLYYHYNTLDAAFTRMEQYRNRYINKISKENRKLYGIS